MIELTVKETEPQVPVPVGLYQAVVKEIVEGTGNYGDYLKVVFEITEGENQGVARTAIASKKLSKSKSGKTSKLYNFVKALTKAEPKTGDVLDIEDLIGKTCQIFIEDGEPSEDGTVFQEVTKVVPL